MNLRSFIKLYLTLPSKAIGLTPQLLFNLRRKDGNGLFISAKDTGERGPSIFIRKFTSTLNRTYPHINYSSLRKCSTALLIGQSWGDTFYQVASHLNIRTVLRMDGFYVPSYFDNRPQPNLHQSRTLTYEMLLSNQQMQRDLFLADHVIYQSLFSKEMCDNYLYKRREGFSIIHNGVDTSVFRLRDINYQKDKSITLICGGNIRHEYMLGTILPMFSKLTETLDLQLLIYGTMDKLNANILSQYKSANKNINNRITEIGPIKNEGLPKLLSTGDIFIHPRAGDSCPNVVVEALASGLPVICPKWGGTAELIGDGGISIDVDKWDYSNIFVEKMTTAVRAIIENLGQFKENARNQAVKNLSLNLMTQQYLDVLFPK